MNNNIEHLNFLKNHQFDIDDFLDFADGGNVMAQYCLGLVYLEDLSDPNNIHKAIFWLTNSANQDYITAQATLGDVYYDEDYCIKDNQLAFKWFLRAACLGDVYAQAQVAFMYKEGEGVEKNHLESQRFLEMAAENGCPESRFILYSQAIESEITEEKKEFILNYLQSSADDGFPDAKFELGQLYLSGRFVENDIEKAKELFYEAGKDGHLPSQHFMGMMLLRNKDDESIKNGLSYILTAAEDSYSPSMNMMGELKEYGRHVDRNGAEALQWYFRAADLDDIFAFYNLGRLFLQGKLVQYNFVEGLKYLEIAASDNHVKAQYDLGIAYKKGMYGLDKDILLAEYWLNLASKTYTPALLELGDLLLRIGTNEKDKSKGIACYKTAIKKGSLQATISLSEIYFNGALIEKNIPKAISLLKSLSKCSDMDIAKYACYQIGNFYNYGIGVNKNNSEAFKWYCLSSDYGSEEGTAELAKMFILGTNGKKNRLIATALQEKTDINVNGVLLINEMTEHAIAIFDKLLHSLWKTKDTRRTISEFLRSDGSKINPCKRVQKN